MIRYVHVGNQIALSEDTPCEAFAFYDTVTDRFIELDGEQVFDTVEDLLAAYDADAEATGIERLLSLMPKGS